jgi:hypothetical protein
MYDQGIGLIVRDQSKSTLFVMKGIHLTVRAELRTSRSHEELGCLDDYIELIVSRLRLRIQSG